MTHSFGTACQVGVVAQTEAELGILGNGIVTFADQLLHKGA
jgi:hypothetical protein